MGDILCAGWGHFMRMPGDTLCVNAGTDYLWITRIVHSGFVDNSGTLLKWGLSGDRG
jgi:hypothetical protein